MSSGSKRASCARTPKAARHARTSAWSASAPRRTARLSAANARLSARWSRLAACASATIKEWLLAAEYLLAGGNSQVVLCERGIKSFETEMRNTLDLAAVARVRELSHLPVIVDPSHATGRRSLVPATAKAALGVGAGGLIIEVHPDPDRALSDGPQSLDLAGFACMMQSLHEPARRIARA